jgi:hypothetical protein
MSLSDHEKSELSGQFVLLAELNEPEALLATVARACQRKAHEPMGRDLRQRWSNVANALIEAEIAVNAAQSPEALKLKAHMTEWSGETPTGAGEDRPLPA